MHMGVGRDSNTGRISIWMALAVGKGRYQWWQRQEDTTTWALVNWCCKFTNIWVYFKEHVPTTTTVANGEIRITLQEEDIEKWPQLEEVLQETRDNAAAEATTMPDLSPVKPMKRARKQ